MFLSPLVLPERQRADMSQKARDDSPPPILCAGILVADIFVPPLAALPEAGQLLATDDFLIDTGGCAANVAAGLARLGAAATVAGKVGNDGFGDFIIHDLAGKGVRTCPAAPPPAAREGPAGGASPPPAGPGSPPPL